MKPNAKLSIPVAAYCEAARLQANCLAQAYAEQSRDLINEAKQPRAKEVLNQREPQGRGPWCRRLFRG